MYLRALAVALAVVSVAVRADAPIPRDDRAILHTLNRLGYGARPSDLDRVRAMGLPAWIDQQLHPEHLDDSALTRRLSGLTTLTLDSKTIVRDYDAPAIEERRRRQRQAATQADAGGTAPEDFGAPASPPTQAQRKNRQVLLELADAKVLRAVYSERQLEEVLVDFWLNHFNVFAGKGPTRNYVTEYERDAIRPHVFGRFRDLLEATAKSPAMLFYLDNWENTSPTAPELDAPRARRGRAARLERPGAPAAANTPAVRPRRGLNENYAREVMELHTLGVDGGYRQQDVVDVARAFTGWTMRPRQGTGFQFAPALHDQGEKHVLGHTLRPNGGIRDGEQVLDILATHPSTARFIATKLAQRFISDTPPQSVIDRAAATFLDTTGDLRAVVRAIVTSPEFFAPDAYRAKVKTPLEFIASALRVTGAEVRNAQPAVQAVRELGMPLYFCQPPTGYDDSADTWVSSGTLVGRMNVALELGANRLRGVALPVAASTTVDDARVRLIADALGGDVSASTRATLAKATTIDQVVALAIGSPEFQKQ